MFPFLLFALVLCALLCRIGGRFTDKLKYRTELKVPRCLGGWEDRIVILAVVGVILLGLYAIRSIIATIRHGTTPPPDALAAANWIVAALKDPKAVPELPAPAARPRRSAML